jgi:acetyl-CoA C-acetyltransferase
MTNPRQPVLVGVGQVVDRTSDPAVLPASPLALLEAAAQRALADAGAAAASIDTIALVPTFSDSSPFYKCPFGGSRNLPRSLGNRLGAAARSHIYGPVGGSTPQMLVSCMADEIAAGARDYVLLGGVEAQRTQARALKAGVALDWSDDPGSDPERYGDDRMIFSNAEAAHQITFPVNVYPLFEMALAHHYGRDIKSHMEKVGALMARFSTVAAHNPYSALPVARTAAEIVTASDDNRLIGFPYTKYLNSNIFVDQAACVLMMSTAKADALGIAQSKRIYLHGSADTHEPWHVSARVNYHSAPSIGIGAAHALAQAGISAADLKHIDLYSCFASAVEIAADEIGLAQDDPRGLTLTGGLCYFGGPGNNYAMHAIAEVVARCRQDDGYGFIFANSYYLTKHSFGVYRRTVPPALFRRAAPALYHQEIDAIAAPPLELQPNGPGRIETYTVLHDKGLAKSAIIIGRLESGARFLSTSKDHAMLMALMARNAIGAAITVTAGQPCNIATFI